MVWWRWGPVLMAIETTCCVCSAHQAFILLHAFLIPVHAHSKAMGQLLSVLAASGEKTRFRATVNHILKTAHQVQWRKQTEAEHSGSSWEVVCIIELQLVRPSEEGDICILSAKSPNLFNFFLAKSWQNKEWHNSLSPSIEKGATLEIKFTRRILIENRILYPISQQTLY